MQNYFILRLRIIYPDIIKSKIISSLLGNNPLVCYPIKKTGRETPHDIMEYLKLKGGLPQSTFFVGIISSSKEDKETIYSSFWIPPCSNVLNLQVHLVLIPLYHLFYFYWFFGNRYQTKQKNYLTTQIFLLYLSIFPII